MGCATSIVKLVVGLFNFLFVVGGIALVALGALFYTGWNNYEAILPQELGSYQFPPVLMIVVGAIIFFIAFMGCCGIVRESKCMMMTYATFLLVLLIAEIVIAVLIYTNQDKLKAFMADGLKESMEKYNDDSEIGRRVKESWDATQINLQCCGVNGPTDWLTIPGGLPDSCRPQGSTIPYTQGCLDKVIGDLKTEIGMYAAGILAAVEALGVFFGCCLGARFGRKTYIN